MQDLYLRELRAYKPAPVAANAHVGAVKEYSAPTSPKAPELPADLASELAAYDAANPDVAVAEASETGAAAPTTSEFIYLSSEPAAGGLCGIENFGSRSRSAPLLLWLPSALVSS